MQEVTRVGEATKGSEHVHVQRTLFLGLGGSGKEVLLRLRRLFYQDWREVGLPS